MNTTELIRPLIELGLLKVLAGWRGRGAHGSLLGMSPTPNPHRGFRFLAEIVSEMVWLYHGFSLSRERWS